MKWVRTHVVSDFHQMEAWCPVPWGVASGPVIIMPSDHADRMLALLREYDELDQRECFYAELQAWNQRRYALLAEIDGAAKEVDRG